MPDPADALCADCGKRVEPPPEVQVLEGEKRFHLACYLRLKRQAPPPARPENQTENAADF
jgi:hypothetical protein